MALLYEVNTESSGRFVFIFLSLLTQVIKKQNKAKGGAVQRIGLGLMTSARYYESYM